ncbi:site-specific integrase [Phenylobacterium sp.]|uniref:tyrosine-type recombinase/integrase n=1 Tax=Phenylobacterium sp. TaxID=1871053 RepID=UPI0025E47463|nr:site-specific integrase [Phenylobacterium sp.]
MASDSHTLMDGKVHVYRRENSRFWQCAVFLGGRNHRASTHQDNLALAMEFARDWYVDRYADDRLCRRGIPLPEIAELYDGAVPTDGRRRHKPAGRTFREAAEAFVGEYEVITNGERNASYVAAKSRHLKLYLTPFFGDTPLSEITAGSIQEYRVRRMSLPTDEASAPPVLGGRRRGRPARNTLHQEMVTLRQVLKTANRKGWLAALPDMSAPYKMSGKISHRAWFSPDEYKRLYEATRARAKNPKNERWRHESKQFHDYVLFMGNTGLRPDEASRLEYRDINVVVDEDTGDRILEIEVRGKRGVGFCKSMPGAVEPLRRLRKRNDPKPTDLVFGPVQRELLNAVLDELDLKKDREGNPRTAYSLRHTYISMRLMEGADIYQIAKNCRTSVEMIQKFYASHIVNTLNAAAINVRKKSKPRNAGSAKQAPANAKAPIRANALTRPRLARTR